MTSRQRAWQQRKIAAGKCGTCGKRKLAATSKTRCDTCREINTRVVRALGGFRPRKRRGGP